MTKMNHKINGLRRGIMLKKKKKTKKPIKYRIGSSKKTDIGGEKKKKAISFAVVKYFIK